jgi:PAT family beta-lactamase induction signal transducer AmpG
MNAAPERVRHPALWVPTSYLSEGIPFAMAIWVVGTMFKNLGHSDTEIALVTGSIGIAWSLKPFWAAFLDMFRTKKFFVLATELIMAGLLICVGLALKSPNYLSIITLILWVLAFASATQDICVDGIYITALSKSRQAAWQGTQSAFWNTGRLFGTAAIVALAGKMISGGQERQAAWTIAMITAGCVMAALAVYHYFVLPTGALSRRPHDAKEVVATFIDSVKDFFQKKSIWGMLLFVFLYRLGEGLLLVEAPLFMQSSIGSGGLGLTLDQKSFIDGTLGTVISVAGALAGGFYASKVGLRKSLLVMALCMNIPHLCYIVLSHLVTPTTPVSMNMVYLLVSIEKFGYNFGFVGNMLYMMQQIAPGKYKMTHYAFATAFMNLVLVPTQSASGWLADKLGYKSFFIFVLVASIPSVIAAWKAPFPDPPEVEPADEGEKAPVPASLAAAAH